MYVFSERDQVVRMRLFKDTWEERRNWNNDQKNEVKRGSEIFVQVKIERGLDAVKVDFPLLYCGRDDPSHVDLCQPMNGARHLCFPFLVSQHA